jgi:signal peptidase I
MKKANRARRLVTKKTEITILLLVCVVSAVGAVAVYFLTPSVQKQYQMVQISSPIMEPAIMQGSFVMVDPSVNPADFKTNYPDSDIIMFHNPDNPNQLIVHRIVATEEINGTTCFYTKGDAASVTKYPAVPSSSDYDRWGAVSPDFIVGKVVAEAADSQTVPLTLTFRALIAVSIAAGLSSLGLYVYLKVKKK